MGQPAPAPLKPGWPVLDTLEKVAFRAAIAKDLWHPARRDDELMDYRVTQEWRLSGKEGGPEVVAEVFPTAKSRAPGMDALSPAARPLLPEGHQWDEGALVLAEIEAHAIGARPSLIMEVTDALAGVMEQAADRGVGWSEADAKAELTRRHGQDGAARVIENARFAYDTLLESEQPLLARRVRELAEAWGDDPGVITLFGTTLYEALRDGPITPTKEVWFLRAEARRAKADAAKQASAAEARRAEEAEAVAASDKAFDQTAAQHRRWQSRSV